VRFSVFEVCVTAGAAAVMAGVVLVGGAALPPPMPIAPPVLAVRQIEAPAGEPGTCFEAPATAPSTSVTVGAGTVCVDEDELRVTLEVTGLTPGEEYAGSLRYTLRPAPCRDAQTAPELPCLTIDAPGVLPSTMVRHIDDGIAPATGVLRMRKNLNDVRFRRGGEVTLELLKLREDAAPQAEAVFILP
jgi:hypothetical protein